MLRMRFNSIGFILLSVLGLAACNSSKDSDVALSDIPEVFTSLQATSVPGALGTIEHIDLSIINAGIPSSSFVLFGLTQQSGVLGLGLSRRVRSNDANAEFIEYIVYSPSSGATTYLHQASPLQSSGFSKDLGTVAWIEECQGFVNRLDQGGSVLHLNPLIDGDSCLRPAQLSDNGNTVIFGNAQGTISTNGELVFLGFDAENFGSIVYSHSSATTTSLAGKDVSFGSPQLDDYTPRYLRQAISSDGTKVVLRTAFLPDDVAQLGEIDFSAGLMLLDTFTGQLSLLDQHRERRAFCQKCYWYPADDLQITADGKFAYFLRPNESDLLNSTAVSYLYRANLDNDKIEKLPIDDEIQKGSLIVSSDGNQIAYLADGKPILLQLSSGSRLELDLAMRQCAAEQCEFESYRFIRNSPLKFSTDGSSLIIMVIPERAEITTPQNIEEVFLVDTEALSVTRMAPDISIERIFVSSDGMNLVFQTNSAGLLPNDEDFDTDTFIYSQ